MVGDVSGIWRSCEKVTYDCDIAMMEIRKASELHYYTASSERKVVSRTQQLVRNKSRTRNSSTRFQICVKAFMYKLIIAFLQHFPPARLLADGRVGSREHQT
jgi:hypothetical protein